MPPVDAQLATCSLPQALELAQAEAKRDLKIESDRISYVAWRGDFHDFMFCAFERHGDGWALSLRGLTNAERQPDEEISDQSIRDLVLAGNPICAIRLHRCKYGSSLAVAKAAIDELRAPAK